MARRLSFAGALLATTIIYFGLGRFGLSLAFVHASASAVWPPTGFALAVLLVWGLRLWPAIFIGAFLVNVTVLGSVAASLGIAGGNTLEAVAGAWLVGRFAGGVGALDSTAKTLRFVLLASLAAPTISATVGVTSLWLGGAALWQEFGAVWLTWWFGDAVSALMVGPFLLLWLTKPFLKLSRREWLELGGLIVTVLAVGQLLFGTTSSRETSALAFVALVPLLWAAYRFGQRAAVTSALLLSGYSVWGTLRGFGPFVAGDTNDSLLLLQSFMGTATLTALVVAAVVSESKRAERLLRVRDAASRVLAEANSVEEAAPRIIEAICEFAGWEVGAVWSVDAEGSELICAEFWHRPEISTPHFEAETRRRSFAPSIGLPGRVWSSGQPVWVADVTVDNNFPRASFALRDGLHAGVCFPIVFGGKVRGVLECFSQRVRHSEPDFLQMLSAIGSQLGQFMERKIAERALRESETRKTAILESALDAIVAMDRHWKIVDFNPAAEQLFGYARLKILGRNFAETILPAREREGLWSELKGSLETAAPLGGRRLEMTAVRADGSEFATEMAITTRRLENGKAFFTAYLRDITERKRAEAALAKAQAELEQHAARLEQTVAERTAKLREAIGELESFSYSISHDMRAPLRAMQAYGQVLLAEHGKHLDPTARRYLDRIVNSSNRMDRLIQDVLAYSRISRAEVQLEPVNLDRLVEDVINEYPSIHAAEIDLHAPVGSVIAAEALLTQAVSNLLTNAAKFIAPGQTSKIKIWSTEVSAAGRPAIRLHIQDNGIGIAPEDQQRIFSIFTRVHSEKEYEGTGIGLSIVKRAVDRMGGQLGLQSEPGQGSTFWIQLRKA